MASCSTVLLIDRRWIGSNNARISRTVRRSATTTAVRLKANRSERLWTELTLDVVRLKGREVLVRRRRSPGVGEY